MKRWKLKEFIHPRSCCSQRDISSFHYCWHKKGLLLIHILYIAKHIVVISTCFLRAQVLSLSWHGHLNIFQPAKNSFSPGCKTETKNCVCPESGVWIRKGNEMDGNKVFYVVTVHKSQVKKKYFKDIFLFFPPLTVNMLLNTKRSMTICDSHNNYGSHWQSHDSIRESTIDNRYRNKSTQSITEVLSFPSLRGKYLTFGYIKTESTISKSSSINLQILQLHQRNKEKKKRRRDENFL